MGFRGDQNLNGYISGKRFSTDFFISNKAAVIILAPRAYLSKPVRMVIRLCKKSQFANLTSGQGYGQSEVPKSCCPSFDPF